MSNTIRTEWETTYKNKESFVAEQRTVVDREKPYDAKHSLNCVAWRVALSKCLEGNASQWQQLFSSLMVLTDGAIAMGKALTDGLQCAPPQYYAVTREDMPTLYQVVDRIAEQAGISPPLITVADHPALANAYVVQSAQSALLNQSLLVVGTHFFALTDDDGIEGILAHECAHVERKDPVQKAYMLFTAPAYINQYYNLLPWLLIGGLLGCSTGLFGTIIALMGLSSYGAKLFIQRWVEQKQVSLSVRIESEADKRAVEIYEPAQKLLPHVLKALKKREDAERVAQDEGFDRLRAFVQDDEELSTHISTALLTFVNGMENNIRALAAQKATTYPPTSDRIAALTGHPKKPLA